MNDMMIDLETLGIGVSAPIISIGAVLFCPETGTVAEMFYTVIKIESALESGILEPATLSWWMKQSDSAREIFNDNNAITLEDALKNLSEFIFENCDSRLLRVWGNGPSFDNAILSNAYKKMNIPLPWDFRNDRDVRTIVDLAKRLNKSRGNENLIFDGIKHNAIDDILFQIRLVSLAYRSLRD